MTEDMHVDPDDLRSIKNTLNTAGGDLFKQAEPLQKTPDVGESSSEVATALASLAAAVGGMSEGLGSLSDGVQNALDHATTSDEAAGEAGRRQEQKVRGS
ncbi:hypothetical protein [Nocardioides albus]|uniref:ESX-1 secretion-associated protein n=1 Tax=Nocardioides albus TaxID=1841 RepID=A0A7W5A106_9ACTN|nr:hypothetical protein [Nocardioides albus]MBB3087540.1 hypothetical protein [Nocardioides albus]GGU09719.1 hypothetical protein GCM10007979_04630 [Nocardioides albus]